MVFKPMYKRVPLTDNFPNSEDPFELHMIWFLLQEEGRLSLGSSDNFTDPTEGIY